MELGFEKTPVSPGDGVAEGDADSGDELVPDLSPEAFEGRRDPTAEGEADWDACVEGNLLPEPRREADEGGPDRRLEEGI